MKKFLLGLAVLVVGLAFASTASAVKLTSKGYMDVAGIYLSNDVYDTAAVENDQNASWYQMELIVDPTLHVTDKVKIHGQVTVMERVMDGTDQVYNDEVGPFKGADYRGENDWWVERLYMSFPVPTGHLYVGRMAGGGWAYPFQDAKDNRDRIKYVGKFGNVVVAALIEKLLERKEPSILGTGATGFQESSDDLDAYAVGAIIPFGKMLVYKPLGYYIHRGSYDGSAYTGIFMNGIMLKAGPLKVDSEINYRWTDRSDEAINPATGQWEDWDEGQFSGWLDACMNFGPAEAAVGGFFLEGTPSGDNNAWENKSLWGLGKEFDPLLLTLSEDVGLLWNKKGVENNSAGSSGFIGAYLRGAFNINDKMKISAIGGWLLADEMDDWDVNGDGTVDSVDDDLGWEVDIGFEWKFLDNIAYVVDAGYFIPGDYYDDRYDDALNGDVNNVYGIRHQLVITW